MLCSKRLVGLNRNPDMLSKLALTPTTHSWQQGVCFKPHFPKNALQLNSKKENWNKVK